MSVVSDRPLRERVRGALLTPGDQGFEEATRLWNGLIDKSPALVVQPTGVADVVEAVRFAREQGLALSVRGGGHNIAGTALADGGLTIDMSGLRGVSVDPDARTATVQPGCLLGDVDRETQLHGLATPLGFFSEVGVAGLTLGRRARLPHAPLRLDRRQPARGRDRHRRRSGSPRESRRTRRPVLGVRGAGANLGVVTRFVLRLHEVGPNVYGGPDRLAVRACRRGPARLPGDHRRRAARADRLAEPPARPRGAVPPRALARRADLRHGRLLQRRPGRADEALAPLRALGDPVVDLLHEQPYTEVQSMLDATEPKGNHYYWKTEFLAGLSDELFGELPSCSPSARSPRGSSASSTSAARSTSAIATTARAGNRDARFACGVLGNWARRSRRRRFPGWIRDAWERVRPFSTGGNYVNLQTADEDDERIRDTYGANFDRLLEVKRRYDPDNLFRSNRNIRA